MQKRRTTLIVVGIVLLTGLVALMVMYPKIQQAWEKPLGPELGWETEELTPSSTNSSGPLDTVSTDGEGIATVLQPSFTPEPEPFCGGPSEMAILAIGTDSRNDNYLYGVADVMRLIHVDFTIPRVAVLTLPRDLWVEVPGISDHYGITHSKLNQAYFYGSPGMGYYDGPGEGAGLLARTLEVNFGFRIDHYGAVNMRTFEDIIDAVGGVDVYLDLPVDGQVGDSQEDNMGYFRAGWHHLSGEAALRLARIRKVDTVFARQDRQTQIICAFKEKLLDPSAITGIPDMISAFSGRVLTDLSPAELGQLACLTPKLTKENLVFASFPQEILEKSSVYDPQFKGHTFVWDVDFDILADYIDRFLAGTWPVKTSEDGISCPDYEENE